MKTYTDDDLIHVSVRCKVCGWTGATGEEEMDTHLMEIHNLTWNNWTWVQKTRVVR